MKIIYATPVMLAVLIMLIIRWYKRNISGPVDSATLLPWVMDRNYSRDKVNIENAISHAKNSWELRMQRKAVTRFRKTYKDSVNAGSVEKDVTALLAAIDQRGVALESLSQEMN